MILALAALALALPQVQHDTLGTPSTTPFRYTYADVRFDYYEVEGSDAEPGFTLSGSYSFFPNVFGLAEYQRLTDDADSDTFFLGAGYYMPITSGIDLTADAAWVHLEDDRSGVLDDDDGEGIRLRAGVRHLVCDPLELNAALVHLNIDSDADTGIRLGSQYRWSNALSFVGSYSRYDDDSDLLDVGLRFEF